MQILASPDWMELPVPNSSSGKCDAHRFFFVSLFVYLIVHFLFMSPFSKATQGYGEAGSNNEKEK